MILAVEKRRQAGRTKQQAGRSGRRKNFTGAGSPGLQKMGLIDALICSFIVNRTLIQSSQPLFSFSS